MHKDIMYNIDLVENATQRILQEQERDLLRAFRARLFDMQVRTTHVSGPKRTLAHPFVWHSSESHCLSPSLTDMPDGAGSGEVEEE